MAGRNKFSFGEEIFKILDIASRITVFFYSLLIDISVFEIIFKLTGSESFYGYLFLVAGVAIFVIHRILRPKNVARSGLMNSFIYYLLLSFTLALFLLSFTYPFFKEMLDRSSIFFSGMGEIMLMYVMVFIYALLLTTIDRFVKKDVNILVRIGVIIAIFLLFGFGMSQVNRNGAANSVGLFLLGPINLLIINILFVN